MSESLRLRGLYSLWNSVSSCFLLQGIFPTQGLNPDLPHCRQILYCLSHQERIFRRPCNGKDHIAMSQAQVCSYKGPIGPRILEWVAYPFSRGSFQLRNQTRVSCIAGGFFTSWATTHTYTLKEKKLRVPIHLVSTIVEIIHFYSCLYFLIFPTKHTIAFVI